MPQPAPTPISDKRRIFFLGIITLLIASLLLLLLLNQQSSQTTLTSEQQLTQQIETVYAQGTPVAQGTVTSIDLTKHELVISDNVNEQAVTRTVITNTEGLVVFEKVYGDQAANKPYNLDKIAIGDQVIIYTNQPADLSQPVHADAISVFVPSSDQSLGAGGGRTTQAPGVQP